jgi:hypothetical protein
MIAAAAAALAAAASRMALGITDAASTGALWLPLPVELANGGVTGTGGSDLGFGVPDEGSAGTGFES